MFSEANDLINALGIKIDNVQKSRILNAMGRASLICKSGSKGLDIGTVFADRWHHIAVTHDGLNACQIFIDGNFAESLSNLSTGNINSIIVGSTTKTDAGFQGKMNHIRMDSRVLSLAEIRRDMSNRVRPIHSSQEIAAPRYWQPTEPVILMTGSGIQATERHGQDGRCNEDDLLECPVLSQTNTIEQLQNLFQGKEKSNVWDVGQKLFEAVSKCSSKDIASRKSALLESW